MESKNLSPMALFTPTEGVKREGSKAGWRGSKNLFFGIYFTLYTRVRGRKEGASRGMKDPKSPLTETQNKL